MPIYEYACPECPNQFELKQSFSAEPVAECPTCGQPARRKLSRPAIVFKGSGFYITDSRSGGSSTSSSSSSPDSAESSSESTPTPSSSDSSADTRSSAPAEKVA